MCHMCERKKERGCTCEEKREKKGRTGERNSCMREKRRMGETYVRERMRCARAWGGVPKWY
jgi:hypothetical protein